MIICKIAEKANILSFPSFLCHLDKMLFVIHYTRKLSFKIHITLDVGLAVCTENTMSSEEQDHENMDTMEHRNVDQKGRCDTEEEIEFTTTSKGL